MGGRQHLSLQSPSFIIIFILLSSTIHTHIWIIIRSRHNYRSTRCSSYNYCCPNNSCSNYNSRSYNYSSPNHNSSYNSIYYRISQLPYSASWINSFTASNNLHNDFNDSSIDTQDKTKDTGPKTNNIYTTTRRIYLNVLTNDYMNEGEE